VRRFELLLPESVEDGLRILAERGPAARVVAGGTDLVPQLKNGVLRPACVVDLSGIAELRRLAPSNGAPLEIGPLVTARALECDAGVRAGYPALAESAALVGSVQVRNLATVGGNLCNAAPSADMAPPLLALDAEAVIAGRRGRRADLAGGPRGGRDARDGGGPTDQRSARLGRVSPPPGASPDPPNARDRLATGECLTSRGAAPCRSTSCAAP